MTRSQYNGYSGHVKDAPKGLSVPLKEFEVPLGWV